MASRNDIEPNRLFPVFALDWREVGKHLLFALVIGAVTGVASVILCLCVNWSFSVFRDATWLVWLLPVIGALQLFLYGRAGISEDLTTHRIVIKIRKDEPVSVMLAPGILVTTCMSILCGASVGKEAAALQMGSSLGALVGRPFKMKSVYKRNSAEPMEGYISATGMAACFSALFFAPLGAAMFVLELARFKRTILKHAATILIACAVAFLISSTFGIGDYIDKVEIPAIDWHGVGQVVVIGVAAAFAGTIMNNAIQWVHDLTWRITKSLYVWVVVGGLLFAVLVAVCGWWPFAGSGSDILRDALNGRFGPWDFAVKLLLTVVCLGFWFKGGEIMPSFCIGGLLGAACTYMTGGSPELGAAVGVMAFFAAFSRCPLAALFMGCEIFGWGIAPHLAIAILVAILCGSRVGYYGEGVDKALRTDWRAFFGRMRKGASIALGPDAFTPQTPEAEAKDEHYVGALHNVEKIGDAVVETLEDPSNHSTKTV